MRVLFMLVLSVLFTPCMYAQEVGPFDPTEKFPPDSIQSWTRAVMEEVRSGHPGFYRYTSPSEFDFLIDSTLKEVDDSLSTLEYYRMLKPLFAKIGCLHTSVTMSEKCIAYLNQEFKLIPIEVFIDQDRQVFITKNHSSDRHVQLKSELISINGQPIAEILSILYKAIPSDGYNQTLKTHLLNHRFAFWYQSIISTQDSFVIETKMDGETYVAHVNGVSKEVFPTMESLESADEEQLTLEIQDDIASADDSFIC